MFRMLVKNAEDPTVWFLFRPGRPALPAPDPSGRVPGVDDQGGMLDDPRPVVGGVVGHDQDAVLGTGGTRPQLLAVMLQVRDSAASAGGLGMCGSLYSTSAPFFRRSSISSKPGDSRGSSTSFL